MARSKRRTKPHTMPARLRRSPRRHPWRWYGVAAGLVLLAVGGLWYGARGSGGSAGVGGEAGAAAAGGELRQVGALRAADYHSLAFSPAADGTLLFGGHNGVMRSPDRGRTWTTVLEGPNLDAMNLRIHPAAPNTVWMAGHNVFYRSVDGGGTWSPVSNDQPGLDLHIHTFTVGSTDPNVLYASAGQGLARSADGGATWQPLPAAPSSIALAAGGNPEVLYVATQQGVALSRDGGATFGPPQTVAGGSPLALAAVPGGDTVYAATPAGLFRSENTGATWTKLGYTGDVAALAVDPNDPQRIAIVDRRGRIFASG